MQDLFHNRALRRSGFEIGFITGGSANNGSGEIPGVNNAAFTISQSYILDLIGAGPWTIAWTAESSDQSCWIQRPAQRSEKLPTAIMINNGLIDNGTTSGTQISYTYTDTEVYHQARYYYWLEDRNLIGESSYHGPLMVFIHAEGEEPEIPAIPVETKLFSAFPNPFNPSTNLRYSMKEAGDVRIEVYNVKGQILKTFESNHNQPGYYQVNWDGRDANGRLAGTGVYFYRMISGKYSSTKKMVLAK